MPVLERQRRRPTTACVACRRRKTRCDRESPCRNCQKSKTKEPCVYEDEPPLALRRRVRVDQHYDGRGGGETASITSRDGTSASAVTTTSTTRVPTELPAKSPASLETEAMRKRIQYLEKQLNVTKPSPHMSRVALSSSSLTPGSDIETTRSQIGGTFHIIHPTPVVPVDTNTDPLEAGFTHTVSRCISRGISHKTRLLGQSHWVNTVAPLVFPMIQILEPTYVAEASKVHAALARAKSLGRTIKAQRAPPWPCPPTTELPPKHLADELVDNYFITVESLYRILHVPSFRRDYEALWTSSTTSNTAFLIQVKLVLALGALTHAPTFSHRSLATRYIYEAQTYLAEPLYKPRLNITHLQIQLLLLLAKELIHVAGDGVWIGAGNILRTAIAMGLHRDPVHLPAMPRFQAEIRRRLWGTIMEVALQTSLATGSPPMIRMEDFDVGIPTQLNDEALSETDGREAADGEYTDASVACALRATFEIRLRIVKHLNDLTNGVHRYEDTLRLDQELRTAFKTMRQTFQLYTSQSSSTSGARFAMQACEYIMLSYLTSIHAPYFAVSLRESKYAYSRKVLVDTSLKMWCAAYSSSILAGNGASSDVSRELFARFITCGTGFFRTGAFRAAFIIIEELRMQLQEDDDLSLGPVPMRTDLLTVAEESISWSLQCLEAGEVSVKGYLVKSVMGAYINGLLKKLRKEELGPLLVRTAEEAADTGIALLEAEAARTRQDAVGTQDEAFSMADSMEDWGFLMPHAMLVPDNQGILGWSIGENPMQGFLF